MVGDSVIIDGVEYEIVWNGGEGLLPERDTRTHIRTLPDKRLYNKKSDYWEDREDTPEESADIPLCWCGGFRTNCELRGHLDLLRKVDHGNRRDIDMVCISGEEERVESDS